MLASRTSLPNLTAGAMWCSCGLIRSLRFVTINVHFPRKCISTGHLYLSSSTSSVDLQGQFVNPRIHNLLQKLVSVVQPTRIHESKFKVEKVHDIKLLSDSELQAVNTLFCYYQSFLGYALFGDVNFSKTSNAPSDECKTTR